MDWDSSADSFSAYRILYSFACFRLTKIDIKRAATFIRLRQILVLLISDGWNPECWNPLGDLRLRALRNWKAFYRFLISTPAYSETLYRYPFWILGISETHYGFPMHTYSKAFILVSDRFPDTRKPVIGYPKRVSDSNTIGNPFWVFQDTLFF